MTPQTEWINNLLDGELESMHESSLFGELAINSDLRSELKQQLAIRSAVQNDRVALMPPVALTSTLFSGLGLAAPLAGAAAGAAGGGFLIHWLTRIGLPLLSTLAAAGITYGVVSEPRHDSSPTQGSSPTTAPPLPSIATTGGEPVGRNVAEVGRLRRENAALRAELRSRPSQAILTERQAEPTVARVALSNSQLLTYSNEPHMLQATTITPINAPIIIYPSFMVQVRGMSGSSLTDVSAPVQTSWYNNMSIGLLYQLSDRNAVGLEIGTESFAMSFEGSQNGQTIRYEQEPLSSWAGVTYRHTLPRFGQTAFAPFGQVLVGGTKFGPLGRLTAGLTYAPSGPLSFIFGIEGSTMAYQYQNSWFGTSKISFTYSLAVRF